MEYITVTRSDDRPASFNLNGRTWHVHDAVRWFERVRWWETETRYPDRTDIIVWQVQARIGHNPRTPLVTFELVLGTDRARWWVRSRSAVAA